MDNTEKIDKLLVIINDLEDAKKEIEAVADEVSYEDNDEVSELLEDIENYLADAVDGIDEVVQLLDDE